MPRNMRISPTHIIDGFHDDCDELLHRCTQIGTLTFDTFTEIWKGMKFASLYKHRGTHLEIAEMSEEFINVAKRRMVGNTSNYEESIAGLFLVYALLNLQPYPGFAPLRITPDDVLAIARIESVARKDRRFDVLYILGSVLIEGPCFYTFVDRPRGMEPGYKKYFEGNLSVDGDNVRPKGVYYRQNTELDLIREMITLGNRYTVAKSFINETNKSDTCLTYTDQMLPLQLESSLKKIISGVFAVEEKIQNQTDDESCQETEERYDLVQRIKSRAMTRPVDTLKHLVGVNERKKQKRTRKKSVEIKKQSGSVKSSSPKKPIKAGTPQKRKSSKPVVIKKKKIRMEVDKLLQDSTSSDDDTSFMLDDDSNSHSSTLVEMDTGDENIRNSDSSQFLDVDVNERDLENSKSPQLLESDRNESNVTRDLYTICEPNEKDNNYIEIEVIDEYTPNDGKPKKDIIVEVIQEPEISNTDVQVSGTEETTVLNSDNENHIKLINETSDVSVKKVWTRSRAKECPKDNNQKANKKDSDVFKKPNDIEIKNSMPKLKVERRNQKKTTVNYKYKKLGMLDLIDSEQK